MRVARYQLIDGKYRIVRLIGQGGWASVYEGVNVRINRRVAIKVLSKDLLSTDAVRRFTHEAQSATRIESKHVVGVFDLGMLEDGRPYIVMELLDGENLGCRLAKTGTIPTERAVEIIVQVLRGLADSHEAGVLHRDVKPENIVLVRERDGVETVKIVDFGISKLDVTVGSSADPRASSANVVTRTHGLLGSPAYMSPEQCRGIVEIDHRSDLYSVGVVLYELLTGTTPHVATSATEMLFAIARKEVPDPRVHAPSIDEQLAKIIMRSLAREPSDRFQTADELKTALVAWGVARTISVDGGGVAATGSSSSLYATPTPRSALTPLTPLTPAAFQLSAVVDPSTERKNKRARAMTLAASLSALASIVAATMIVPSTKTAPPSAGIALAAPAQPSISVPVAVAMPSATMTTTTTTTASATPPPTTTMTTTPTIRFVVRQPTPATAAPTTTPVTAAPQASSPTPSSQAQTQNIDGRVFRRSF